MLFPADISLIPQDGRVPLQIAVDQQDFESAELLLKAKADVRMTATDGVCLVFLLFLFPKNYVSRLEPERGRRASTDALEIFPFVVFGCHQTGNTVAHWAVANNCTRLLELF